MEAGLTQADPPVLLFVEDNHDWSYLFCSVFKNLAPHWEIICARDGSAALRYLISAPAPQALVTDLIMPGMNGVEFIEWVKDQSQFRFLPVIVLSNSDDPSHRRHCAAQGVGCYLNKPGSLKELRE